MNFVNKIKFLLKLFSIKESDFNEMVLKSESYDKVLSCIEIETKTEYYRM
jgi:hypothetical protein